MFGGTFGAGRHRAEVAFANGAYAGPGQNLNVHVHGIESSGRNYAGRVATIDSGTRAFAVRGTRRGRAVRPARPGRTW